MRVGSLIVFLLFFTAGLTPATARPLAEGPCTSLTATSLQFSGEKLASLTLTSRDGCCEACMKTPGCQMWWFKDNTKDFACEMYGLSKVWGSSLTA